MLYVIEDKNIRPYMEDYYSINIDLYNGYDYIAVFDGHGGYNVSEFLKFHFKNFVRKHLSMNKTPADSLFAAFDEANRSMPLDMSFSTGSAAIVILRKNNDLWIANCGDCRAIISSRQHNVIPLSIDHKPHRQDEMERIQNLGGNVTFNPNDVPRVQGNLALSRSLGDKYLYPFVIAIPEIKYFNITNDNQYIVMASDGLWDVYSNDDVVNIINNTYEFTQNTRSMRYACHNLLNGAKTRGSGDNITIILWHL